MSISKNIRDREFDKFRGDEKPETRVAVEIENTNPVPVEFSQGVSVNTYGDAIAIAIGASVDVVSYTVPVGKVFVLNFAEGSGCSVSEYSILADSAVIAKRRTAHGNYDFVSPFGGAEFVAGSVIKINASNTSGKINEYDCKLVGSIKDA